MRKTKYYVSLILCQVVLALLFNSTHCKRSSSRYNQSIDPEEWVTTTAQGIKASGKSALNSLNSTFTARKTKKPVFKSALKEPEEKTSSNPSKSKSSRREIDLSDLPATPDGPIKKGSSSKSKKDSSLTEEEDLPEAQPASQPSSSFISSSVIFYGGMILLAVAGGGFLVVALSYIVSHFMAQRSSRLRYLEAIQKAAYTRRGDGLDNYRDVAE
ncbi:hypothetical protein NEHOM01_1843 [Nematocida homosporus]|uniref:uncharacterized protein n=1 Tax=Nematocida homosporus TaxID=1912981 RepID=UPI00221EF10C|nr:uncharacterized protein NEHOM01_1843 [Nematocida homosporus]KAI5186985.1 hypothetical protein NEHOM01_1843 [Nematocida homosporus]